MIGYFDYTVWLTYASLLSAVVGIIISLSGTGHPYIGSFFLMFSGLCDAFDGRVARSKKDRSAAEKQFGIQIDSLSDLIAFGVLPACIGYALCKASATYDPLADPCLVARIPTGVYVIVFCIYVLAAQIRLAWFNVTEEENQRSGNGHRISYTGLPVTSASLIFPSFLLIRHVLNKPTVLDTDIAIGYFILMLGIAFAFIGRFTVRKPGLRGILIMVGIGIAEFILLLLVKYSGFRAF